MHGFLSRDGLPPATLVSVGREEVVGYGGEIVPDTVRDVRVTADGIDVILDDGGCVTARRVLVATGLHDELPEVPGLRERWARDVLHCPYCHGWEVRDQRLAVLADGSPESVRYAQIVRQWSDDVVLITRATAIVVEDDRLVGVELPDGSVMPRDAIFVPPRFVPNNDLLVALGCAIDENGWVVKDATGRTSVPSVWVAGNVSNPRAQVITAAGEGSAAAIAINADLVDEDNFPVIQR
jgi:thioredoxin reductase